MDRLIGTSPRQRDRQQLSPQRRAYGAPPPARPVEAPVGTATTRPSGARSFLFRRCQRRPTRPHPRAPARRSAVRTAPGPAGTAGTVRAGRRERAGRDTSVEGAAPGRGGVRRVRGDRHRLLAWMIPVTRGSTPPARPHPLFFCRSSPPPFSPPNFALCCTYEWLPLPWSPAPPPVTPAAARAVGEWGATASKQPATIPPARKSRRTRRCVGSVGGPRRDPPRSCQDWRCVPRAARGPLEGTSAARRVYAAPQCLAWANPGHG